MARLVHPDLGLSAAVDVPTGSVPSLMRRGWMPESTTRPARPVTPRPPTQAVEPNVSEGDDSTTPHEED